MGLYGLFVIQIGDGAAHLKYLVIGPCRDPELQYSKLQKLFTFFVKNAVFLYLLGFKMGVYVYRLVPVTLLLYIPYFFYSPSYDVGCLSAPFISKMGKFKPGDLQVYIYTVQ